MPLSVFADKDYIEVVGSHVFPVFIAHTANYYWCEESL